MIRIGDFSRLSRVSVKTLRYYDEVELLKPLEVDRFTGYRYYSFDQIPRLNRILALRDLGFSLEQIGQLLSDSVSPEQMRGMLKLRKMEIQQRVDDEKERLERVDARLRQIETEENMSNYDVVIKKIEPLKVAAIRGIVPTPPEQGDLWQELGRYLKTHKNHPTGGSWLTLYYDEEHKERDWDIEVCNPIEGDLPESDRVKVYILPGIETMACTIHNGPFITIHEAYDALFKWIHENGYSVMGPCREIYLREAKHQEGSGSIMVSQTDSNTMTEIQFPVGKV